MDELLDPSVMRDMLVRELEKRAAKRMPQMPVDPLRGMDAVPAPPPVPAARQQPWQTKMSQNGLVFSLPANKGADFDAYVDWDWSMKRPLDMKLNGAGLRYRYNF